MNVYSVILGAGILAFLLTFRYKRKLINKLNKKEHKLWLVYGLAMYIADKVLFRITKDNGSKVKNRLQKLHSKENVELEQYLYVVHKYAIAITVIYVALLLSVCSQIKIAYEDKPIKSLTRNKYGEGETIYYLQVDTGDTKENVEIIVPHRELSRDEIMESLKESKSEIVEVMLGENESCDNVRESLNLVSNIHNGEVQVVWEISAPHILGYDGVLSTDIDEKGEEVVLAATLSRGGIEEKMEIVIKVFPNKENYKYEQILQNEVNQADKTKAKIKLPDQFGETSVAYYGKVEDYSLVFPVVGCVMAIIMFFLKDRDMDKEIKKRNTELLDDYPEIVNKTMLFCQAGLSLRKTFEELNKTGMNKKDHYVYKEIKLVVAKLKGGISESLVYEQFGRRCGTHCYIRFANILNQNLRRGTRELTSALKGEMESALMDKKNNRIKAGEEAGTKFLLPMILQLVVGLVLLIAPAFMSLQ